MSTKYLWPPSVQAMHSPIHHISVINFSFLFFIQCIPLLSIRNGKTRMKKSSSNLSVLILPNSYSDQNTRSNKSILKTIQATLLLIYIPCVARVTVKHYNGCWPSVEQCEWFRTYNRYTLIYNNCRRCYCFVWHQNNPHHLMSDCHCAGVGQPTSDLYPPQHSYTTVYCQSIP